MAALTLGYTPLLHPSVEASDLTFCSGVVVRGWTAASNGYRRCMYIGIGTIVLILLIVLIVLLVSRRRI